MPMHINPFFKKRGFKKKQFPVAEKYGVCSLSLPVYYGIPIKKVQQICRKIKSFFFKKFYIMLKKFIIGTAQFGSRYGVSNTSGKTKTKEVEKILSLLDKKKIYFIDTSTNYGKAEKILSNKIKKKTKIITKISAKKLCLNKIENIRENIFKQLKQSKKNLKNKSIYALLINNADLMLTKKGTKIFETLKRSQKKKIIKKYGYSIYSFSNLKKNLQ